MGLLLAVVGKANALLGELKEQGLLADLKRVPWVSSEWHMRHVLATADLYFPLR